ncbi:MAG: response regulator [Chloroflexi bacterium]|nr:MAG: response regulator [Chloroflexota bacterium]
MNPLILIVDDQADTRRMLGMLLNFNGFQVNEAFDGVDALEKIQTAKPDAMILDVMMPRMDGITLCKKLRNHPQTVDLPIIMLSGKTTLEAENEGLQAGANSYMFKPMAVQLLLENINQLLEAQSILQPA